MNEKVRGYFSTIYTWVIHSQSALVLCVTNILGIHFFHVESWKFSKKEKEKIFLGKKITMQVP